MNGSTIPGVSKGMPQGMPQDGVLGPSQALLLEIMAKYSPVHGYLSLTVCAIGVMMNVTNIYILSHKQMVSPVNKLLQAIAAADMVTMLSYIPYSLLFYVLHGTEDNPNRNTYTAVCYLILHALCSIIAHTTSIWLTVAVALFRYLHLTTAKAKRWCSLTNANITIVIVVILSIVINIPQCLVYSIKQHEDSVTNNSWYYVGNDNSKYGNQKYINMAQHVVIAVVVKIIPCVLLAVLSALLIRLIQSAHSSYKAMHKNQSASSSYKPSANEQLRCQQTMQTTRMLLAVVIIFMIIELPQGVLFVLNGIIKYFFEKVYWPLGNILDLLTIIGCCVNFILYCTMSSQFCQLLTTSLRALISVCQRQSKYMNTSGAT